MIRWIGLALFAALAAPAAAEDAQCLISVAGTEYLHGPCEAARSEDGTVTVGASDTAPVTYFAYLVPKAGAFAGYWNGTTKDSHAHVPLGRMTKDGDCWISPDAKICVTSDN